MEIIKSGTGRYTVRIDSYNAGEILGANGRFKAENKSGQSLGYWKTKRLAAIAIADHYRNGSITPQSALGID